MSNSTQFKECRKGTDCVHPDGPNLPTSEYYARKGTHDGLFAECKACRKEIARNQTRLPKGQAGEEGECIAVAKLRSIGIYATSGKSSEFTHVDVVAWGAVRIETKTADKKTDGTYSFAFSSQRRSGIHADLILLILRDNEEIDYHLFPATHPIFFKHGKVKNTVQYIPHAHHRKRGFYLSPSIMNEFRDAWYLIEEKRLELSRQLAGECFKPERVEEPGLLMQPLFKDAS